jgi:hypothetical protein
MPRWNKSRSNISDRGQRTSNKHDSKVRANHSKAIIVPDWKYVRRGATAKLGDALKYYQYRDDRNWSKDENFRELCRDRWVDLGLGKNWYQIMENCEKLHGHYVEAWTWVINPSPQLMALVPEDQRQEVIRELTENCIEAYYDARSYPTPEYSYVVHDRLTKPNEQGVQLQDLHTHVVLPGTVVNPFGDNRTDFFNNVSKGDDVILREVMTAQLEQILDQSIGLEWRTIIQEQERAADQPELAVPDSDSLDLWFPRPDKQFDQSVPSNITIIEQSQAEPESLTPELDINDQLDDPEQDDQSFFDLER